MLKRQKGFTLIEVLIVAVVIGTVAAIVTPNLIDALQKAKQKRTISDMRATGAAWMNWLTDQVGAASAGSSKPYNPGALIEVDYSTVFSYLRPGDSFFYQADVPQFDAWGNPFCWQKSDRIRNVSIVIISPGRDKKYADGSPSSPSTPCPSNIVSTGPFLATDYDHDIIWADGHFICWPE